MRVIYKLTPNQETLMQSGHMVEINGRRYHSLPFWYKELGNRKYEIVDNDDLIEKLNERITEIDNA